ncbi:MAG TPA: DMT family transporter [Candidatus Merdenecus merdavium]|nr:DMT family transporter [Candidatus Merdenecus merdavium]
MKDKTENYLTKTSSICILALICTALWGSAYPGVKIGYELFGIESKDYATQILFAGYRFALAGVLTFIIGCVLSRKIIYPKKKTVGPIAMIGMVQTTLQYIFFYLGLSNTSGVNGAIVAATNTFFLILLAHFFIKGERLNISKVLGCILGFLGVVTINLGGLGQGGGFHLKGEGFLLIAACSYGLGSVLTKQFAKDEDPTTLTAYQLLLGGILLIFLGLSMGGQLGQVSSKGVFLLLYLAMLSAVAFTLWTVLLKYNPVGKISIYSFMIPVFGVMMSAIFLGEQAFTIRNIMALLFVCAGIYIVNKGGEYTIKKKKDQ